MSRVCPRRLRYTQLSVMIHLLVQNSHGLDVILTYKIEVVMCPFPTVTSLACAEPCSHHCKYSGAGFKGFKWLLEPQHRCVHATIRACWRFARPPTGGINRCWGLAATCAHRPDRCWRFNMPHAGVYHPLKMRQHTPCRHADVLVILQHRGMQLGTAPRKTPTSMVQLCRHPAACAPDSVRVGH